MSSSPTTRSKSPKASRWRKKSPKTTRSEIARPRKAPLRLCVVGLGSNLGDSSRILEDALRELARLLEPADPLRVAPFYRTEPVSDIAQPAFLNTVAATRTALPAETILRRLHALERRFGRVRRDGDRDGAPRTLDLDLLVLGSIQRRKRPPLLPHPRLRERRFVLAPLADLEPELALPPDGATVRALLRRLPSRPWVKRLGKREPDSN
jgi:2-amino-4-hydroxy-6-hydroxymethyldihydropteridine diphosphokinase